MQFSLSLITALALFKSISALPIPIADPRLITRMHTADAVTTTELNYHTVTSTIPIVEILISNGVTYTNTLITIASGEDIKNISPTTTLVVNDATTTTSSPVDVATTPTSTSVNAATTVALTTSTPTSTPTAAVAVAAAATTTSSSSQVTEPTTSTSVELVGDENVDNTTSSTSSEVETTSSTSSEVETTSSTSSAETTSSTEVETTSSTSSAETTSSTEAKTTADLVAATTTSSSTSSTEAITTTSSTTSTSSTSTSSSSTTTTSSTTTETSSGIVSTVIPSAIVYSPYEDDGSCKSYDTVFTDLTLINSKSIGELRIYGNDCNYLTTVLPIANKFGMKVNQGFWISSEGVDSIDDAVTSFIDAVSDGSNGYSWDLFSYITIGNEAIISEYCSVSDLISKISSVKSLLQDAGYTGKVTTSEPPVTFSNYPELCTDSDIDFVGINTHSYFDTYSTAASSGSFVAGQITLTQGYCPNMDVLVTETGYPSKGIQNGGNIPSEANQKIAIQAILDTVGSDVTLLSTYNDYWKSAGEYGIEQSFGIITIVN
ncbi:glycoside hydrolase family 17 protein [[Candida] arabinofermentans NRRL YB-2248]|uniref:Glycoside hydrolase family 17 protein n=1 Tax=[Candida] arabinofermentans NRRL YB-2248 TaxID=983967 RepID=A0A1E4SVP5_9ASCO|nr:glycoside hydrolase family 17 protein [[Candida] arabinofermentans NRRL YB-2248]